MIKNKPINMHTCGKWIYSNRPTLHYWVFSTSIWLTLYVCVLSSPNSLFQSVLYASKCMLNTFFWCSNSIFGMIRATSGSYSFTIVPSSFHCEHRVLLLNAHVVFWWGCWGAWWSVRDMSERMAHIRTCMSALCSDSTSHSRAEHLWSSWRS